MKEAIQKAIEGGYVRGSEDRGRFLLNLPDYAKSQIWLDPLFWQALGKQQGWELVDEGRRQATGRRTEWPEWSRQWYRFIDHLAEGKDAESFFKNLLNLDDK